MFDGLTDREVMAAADLALYEAKETGRNRFVIDRPRREGPPRSARMAETERVRHAITRNDFELHCQPVLNLATQIVEQYELLVRLRTDDRQLLTPNAFLHVAERFGTIAVIDSWVVGRACGLLAEAARRGRRVKMSMNVSAKSIGPDLVAAVDRALSAWRVDPRDLVFELTETAAIGNIDEAVGFVTEVRSRGCGVALDDFGAGFGSYHYIKRLPCDYFKIDGDVVRGCTSDASDRLILQAISSIARGMGTKTVAKGVANEETTECLHRSGIDYAQGFHIGMPRPLGDAFGASHDGHTRELGRLVRRPA
jgi:EAL domain-containing protein (putative c-di-GMP-specific phosphodiesterase class I)